MTTDDVATSDDDVTSLSPLQQIVAFSKDAVEKLTRNEKRARYVAKGISDYATKVPAGYTIDSSTISTVLRSKDGEIPHTETVSDQICFDEDPLCCIHPLYLAHQF